MSDDLAPVPLTIVGTLKCVTPERYDALLQAESRVRELEAELVNEGARWPVLVKELRERVRELERRFAALAGEKEVIKPIKDGPDVVNKVCVD